MERRGKLDVAGAAEVIRFKNILRVLLLLAAVCCSPAQAQTDLAPTAKQLFEQERWSDLAQLLQKIAAQLCRSGLLLWRRAGASGALGGSRKGAL